MLLCDIFLRISSILFRCVDDAVLVAGCSASISILSVGRSAWQTRLLDSFSCFFWSRFLLYFTFVVNVLIWFYDLCGMLYCPMPPQANKINRSVYTSIRPSSTKSKDHFTMSTRWLRAFPTAGTLPNDVFPFARMNVSSVDVCVYLKSFRSHNPKIIFMLNTTESVNVNMGHGSSTNNILSPVRRRAETKPLPGQKKRRDQRVS